MNENIKLVKFIKDKTEIPDLFQYDTGQYLYIPQLPDGSKIEFYRNGWKETINAVLKNKKVLIPNELLILPGVITVYISYNDTEQSSTTTVKVLQLTVKSRPKSSYSLYSPIEPNQDILYALIVGNVKEVE